MAPHSKGMAWNISVGVAAIAATTSSYSAYIGVKPMTQQTPYTPASKVQSHPTASLDERLVDAKLEAVEARTETKFAQLIGKMDMIVEKLGAVSVDIGALKTSVAEVDRKTNNMRIVIVSTVIATGIAIVGILQTFASHGHEIVDSMTAAYSAGISTGQANVNKIDESRLDSKNDKSAKGAE